MTTIADFVRDQMKTLGANQKELARRFHDALEHQSLSDKISFETVQPKLSKLLNGDEEGERFFFADPARVKAFADALETSVEELERFRCADVGCVTLVLDPRLPESVRDFLRAQEDRADGRYHCVSVENADDIRVRLRDEFRKARNALVVTATADDASFFAGAEVKTSALECIPRGWRLTALPNLVPVPPPAPPRLWDDDGSPLVPSEELTQSLLKQRGYDPLSDRARATIERGEVPTYPLTELLKHLWSETRRERAHPEFRSLSFGRPSSPSLDSLLDRYDTTYVWWEGKKVFSVGAARHAIEAICAPWHPIEQPEWVRRFLSALDSRNPRHLLRNETPEEAKAREDERVARERSAGRWTDRATNITPGMVPSSRGRELLAASGAPPDINLEGALAAWAREKAQWNPVEHKDVQRDRVEPEAEAPEWWESENGEAFRESLLAILRRPLKVASERGDLVLLLRQLARADLVPLTPSLPKHLHGVANLGAGRWVEIVVVKYDEKPTPYTLVPTEKGAELDGGDVHVWIRRENSWLLEGHFFAARARRTDD